MDSSSATDAEAKPMDTLIDDMISECKSETRSDTHEQAANSRRARLAAAAAEAAASAATGARFDHFKGAYMAQRRVHPQHATTPDSSTTAASAVAVPRRVRKPRPKKGTRASAFMHWLFDTFDLKDRNRRAKQQTVGNNSVDGSPSTAAAAATTASSESTATAATASASDSPVSSALAAPRSFHVVDVAGGRGQLAFFLSAFHSIPVSVIDPASMDGVRRYSERYHAQRVQYRRDREERNCSGGDGQTSDKQSSAAAASASTAPPALAAAPTLTPAASNEPVVLPNGVVLPVPWLPELSHFRCMFPDSIALSQHKQFGQRDTATPTPKQRLEHAATALRRTAACNPLTHLRLRSHECFLLCVCPIPTLPARPVSRQCCESSEDDEAGHDDSAVSSPISSAPALSSVLSAALASTLSSASLLYGMHSDGATEALVDYALLHAIDFAVVPCCVFPDAAPHRRVRAAAKPHTAAATGLDAPAALSSSASASSSSSAEWVPVRSYAQFLDYLQAKHPEIRRVDLPFEGRNTCLYRRVNSSAHTH